MLKILTLVKDRIRTDDMARHGLLMSGFGLAVAVFNYLYQLAMGRMLSPENYGTLLSLTSLFVIITIFARTIRTVITKFVSKYATEDNWPGIRHLWKSYLKRMLLIGTLAFIIVALLSPLISYFLNIDNNWYIVILFSSLIFALALPVNYGVLNGLQRFTPLGITLTLLPFLKVVLAVLLTLYFGLVGGLLPFLIAHLIVFAVTFWLLRNMWGGGSKKIESSGFSTYVGLSFIAMLSFIVLTNIDVVLAKHYLGPEQAGNYSALSVLGRIALFAPIGITAAMFPKTSGLHEAGLGHRSVFWIAMLLTLLLTGGVVIIYKLFPGFVVNLLGIDEVGASKYPLAAPHLVRYGVAMMFFALAYVLVNYFLSLNLIKVAYLFLGTALLQVVLILYYHQDIGQIANIMLLSSAVCLLSMVFFYMWARKQIVLPKLIE